jgi:hypothetical protein
MVQCKCEDHAPTSHSWTGFKCQVMHCASSLQAWTCKLVLHNGTQHASVQIQLSSLICAPCDTFMWLWRSLLPWQQSCQIFKLRSLNDPIWRHDDGPRSHAGLIWFSPTLFSKKLVFCLQAHKIASSRSSSHHHKSCGGGFTVEFSVRAICLIIGMSQFHGRVVEQHPSSSKMQFADYGHLELWWRLEHEQTKANETHLGNLDIFPKLDCQIFKHNSSIR